MTSYQNKNNTYDNIAESYELTEFSIAKKYSYSPTFVSLCKGVKNKRIIDIACGSGYSTRLLVENYHPKNVVGLDASKKMIDLAVEHERENPLGIKYFCGKVTEFDFNLVKPIDAVTALFLLHYAQSKEELLSMCKAIYGALPSGGKFISVTSNSEYPEMIYKKYEVTSRMKKMEEGASRIVTYWKDGKKLCSFENYYWKVNTLKKSLKQVGFRKIIFHKAIISSEGYKLFGKNFWNGYLKKPHIIGIICIK